MANGFFIAWFVPARCAIACKAHFPSICRQRLLASRCGEPFGLPLVRCITLVVWTSAHQDRASALRCLSNLVRLLQGRRAMRHARASSIGCADRLTIRVHSKQGMLI